MEHLENDMDDLFQKAGELYPLKTSESDWKGMLGKLNEEGLGDEKAVLKMNSGEFGTRRRWLLLLLLIPVGIGSIIYFSTPRFKNHLSVLQTVSQKANSTNADLKATKNPHGQAALGNANLKTPMHMDQTGLQSGSLRGISAGHSGKTATGMDRQNKATRYSSNIKNEIIDANLALAENSVNSRPGSEETLAEKSLSMSVISRDELLAVDGMPIPSTASKNLNDLLPGANTRKAKNTLSNKGLYVGFLGGPDLSAVQFQSVKQLGFSLGATIGYRFNRRFAIETGLLWDKKYYYSNGEYFNKSDINLSPNSSILTVNGNCNMLEIPITLRYDFAYGTNHAFFVKGGVSSYIMNHENYVADVNTSGWPWNYSFNSNTAKHYFFSIIQLSAGYEHSISERTKMSFEPYIKIPLQGFGIGNMPISSAGFYIGISYSFR